MATFNSDSFDSISQFEPDGLCMMPIKDYVEIKYRLFCAMTAIFARAMHSKWNHLIYIDLFAGPGVAQGEDNGRVLKSSPLLAQSLEIPFTKYILCEANEESANALVYRCNAHFPDHDTEVVLGDCNERIGRILELMPSFSRENTGLMFCYADPYCLRNLRFETIRSLSQFLGDFLILIPTGMDGVRNFDAHLVNDQETSLDLYLGTRGWRDAWHKRGPNGTSKEHFITEFFVQQMCGLDFHVRSLETAALVRNPHRNQALYRLAYFSRKDLGDRLWAEAVKCATPQGKLF